MRATRVGGPQHLLAALLLLGLSGCPSEEPASPCADGEVLDAADACVPEACGASLYASFDGDAVHVARDGSSSGDGSADDPLDSVADAVEQALDDGAGAVLIGAGAYQERVHVDGDGEGLEIIGRCRQLTRLDAPDGLAREDGVVRLDGSDLRIASVTIRGGDTAGVVAGRDGPADGVDVDDVFVDGASWAGVTLLSGRGRVRDTDIERVRPIGDPIAAGLWVALGGSWAAEDVTVTDFEGIAAVLAEGFGSTLEVTNLTVAGGTADGAVAGFNRGQVTGTGVSASNFVGAGLLAVNDGLVDVSESEVRASELGIAATDGGTVRLTDGAIVDPTDIGAIISSGSVGALTRVMVSQTEPVARTGVSVAGEGTLTGVELTVAGPFAVGLYADDATLSLTTSTVQGARQQDQGNGPELGIGMTLAGATVDLVGTRVENCEGLGILASEQADVRIDDLEVHGPSLLGGITVADATLSGEELVIADVSAAGLAVGSACPTDPCEDLATATVSSVTIGPVSPSDFGQPGLGVQAQQGGTATLHEATITGVQAGAHVQGGRIDLDTVTFEDLPQDAAGRFGYGLSAVSGRIDAAAVTVTNAVDVAAFASSTGVIDWVGGAIEGVAAGGASGTAQGLAAQGGGRVDASGLAISGVVGPGALAFEGGAISITSTTVDDVEFAGAAVYGGGSLTLDGVEFDGVTPSARDGGGVGIFGQTGSTAPASLAVAGGSVTNATNGCVYLLGEGSYAVGGASLSACGTSSTAVGLLAADGVRNWNASTLDGLLVDDLAFGPLDGDAVLLDGSGGTFSNLTFDSVGGEHFARQRCDGAPEPEVDDAALQVACAQTAVVVEPFLDYAADLTEVPVDP